MYCLNLLLVLLLFVKREVDLALLRHKFAYEKDMSEHCRRRVMPSVFLGRQVTDAYSQILQFSRLELPYTCFVSIRTESGSNIILVINLMTDKSLIDACQENKDQLLVYEIGETFGGYWGALPDDLMTAQPSTKANHVYTLKTTHPTTTSTRTRRTTTLRTTPSTTEDLEAAVRMSTKRVDEIVVEVPLINVSAVFVPGELKGSAFDVDENFDTMIDVKPRPGGSYNTKVVPLVQFAISDKISGPRTGDAEEAVAPRYEVDLNADLFTPDARLSYPLLRLSTRSKQRGKYKNYVNSRLDFKKNKKLLAEKEALFHRSQPSYKQATFDTHPSYVFPRPSIIETSSKKETEHISNPYEIVDAILKNLSKTKDVVVPKTNVKIDKDVENLLQGLAKIGHNENGFLVPNASWYTRRPTSTARHVSKKYRTDSITWRQPSASYRTNYLDEEEDTSTAKGSSQLLEDDNKSFYSMLTMNYNDSVIIDVEKSGPLLPPALDIDRILLNVTQQINEMEKSTITVDPETLASEVSGTTTTATTPEILIPMTLVDHESWENMVQAASLMAVVLNQSITSSVGEEQQGVNVTLLPPEISGTLMRRKKRSMHAIPIHFAKPHHLPAKTEVPSSTARTLDLISDAQEFQRLIELQDDEVHDRVALRYLHQYVGPALFNICDSTEVTSKHVYLFNSSRLVLALTNFTLDRMTVVMTPARTLLTTDARCGPAHLECQVSGARVCIDSLCACDGVPNCGQYEIYDEDRLSCGGSAGLQHNVYLAAITFLAVLLTVLYTVHYWLKRCVPKVSDAFFIYTDAAENILYLDSIMRSPHDTDDPKDIFRSTVPLHGIFNMECADIEIITKKTVGSLFSTLCQILRCKRKKKQSRISDDQINAEAYDDVMNIARGKRIYSFAEVELAKIGSLYVVDAAVQTGSSFEIHLINESLIKEQIPKEDSDSEDIVAHYEGKPRSTVGRPSFLDLTTETSEELSILNFFKRARSISMQVNDIREARKSVQTQAKYTSPVKTEEKEIKSLEYDRISLATGSVATVTAETSDEKPESLVKKLRFEEAMTIHGSDDDVVEEDPTPDERAAPRRSVAYGGGKTTHSDETNSNTNADEPSTSTGNREFKSYFWGSGKNKPKIKPTKKKG